MLKTEIFFSIIIPLYNKEDSIKRAVNSVLNQTYQNFELLIIDDGSTDNSLQIVKKLISPKIVIKSKENSGVSETRNLGISLARSAYVSFLDADDEWLPFYLETIVELITNFPDCGIFATVYQFVNPIGKVSLPIINGIPPKPWIGIIEDYFNVASISDPPVCSSAITVKKEAIQKIGGFPKGVTAGEDLITWAKIALEHKIAYNSKVCSSYFLRAELAGSPQREPDKEDYVGETLIKLLNNQKTIIPGFNRYVALWFKMRAVTFLEFHLQKNALAEIKKGLQAYPLDKILWVYAIIAYSPKLLSKLLLKILTFTKNLRRKI